MKPAVDSAISVPSPAERDHGAPGTRVDPWVVVLAGGNGRRMQAFTREILGTEYPKQFCRIIGTRTMLRHTWDRALRMVPPERIVTVITAGQEAYLDQEARRGIPGTVLVQPRNRETAAGLLLPLVWIARRDPGASVAVLPADHFIWEEERFVEYVNAAMAASRLLPDRLTVLGVEADGPDQNYGWIAPGERVMHQAALELYAVRRFWEKPDLRTATRLFVRGYLWNTFVLAGRLDAYLRLAERFLPEILTPLRVVADRLTTPAEASALARAYAAIPSTDISRAFLARHPEALLVLAARGITWCDWGDPDRIIQSLRRIDIHPVWLPIFTRTMASPGEGRLGPEACGKEKDYATV